MKLECFVFLVGDVAVLEPLGDFKSVLTYHADTSLDRLRIV